LTRVAVVDLGTNSTRLLVADVRGGVITEIARRLTITKLGEDVDESRRLRADAIARVEECLEGYRAEADALHADRRVGVATSAVRDAANGVEFLTSVERRFGLPTRLLSGDEEALLTFRGVASRHPLEALSVVIDLGGGSTELVLGDDDGVRLHRSLDIGCVRLTERFLHHDPPRPDEIAALRAFVRRLVEGTRAPELRPSQGFGVAGTVTTLATLDLGLADEDPALVDGHELSLAGIEATASALAAAPVAELRERRGLHPGRAPVIAAGALAVAEIVAAFALDSLRVSEQDILHGAALELAGDLAR
jgi:exopolyphosphatase/guanosine-5'-triphosphate,3'-diphosphate pyrophosphatase